MRDGPPRMTSRTSSLTNVQAAVAVVDCMRDRRCCLPPRLPGYLGARAPLRDIVSISAASATLLAAAVEMFRAVSDT